MLHRILMVVAVICFSAVAAAEELNADEKAVWAPEEAYWRYVEANDLEGYRSLWDERFIGWPGGNVGPAEKRDIANWIPPLHTDPNNEFRYELKREAVRSFGDVVVTHYSVRGYNVSKDSEAFSDEWFNKITHTWQRHGDRWQIITGMAGDYPPAE